MFAKEFSVLMSVYIKENADFFYKSLESIWNQSVRPSEVILVCDGPLSDELEGVIEHFLDIMNGKLVVKRLEKNVGLGRALNYGMEFCKYDYIARMDTDDIALPNRFEKQINFLENNPNVVILGSYIGEFDTDENIIISKKIVPIDEKTIKKYAKKRNPFNHMSVIFRKDIIELVGGYEDVPYFEDYYLWIKVLNCGYETANLPEILIYARIGNGMIDRRGGISYVKKIWNMRNKMYKLGFISIIDYIFLSLIQSAVALVPKGFRSFIYKNILRKK